VPDTGVPETTENTISVAELTVRDTITNGRKVIYTSESEITADNVVDVLRYADSWHQLNVADIDWLYAYWHGKQPILYREKEIRPEIKTRSLRTTRTRLCRSIPGMCSPIRSST